MKLYLSINKSTRTPSDGSGRFYIARHHRSVSSLIRAVAYSAGLGLTYWGYNFQKKDDLGKYIDSPLTKDSLSHIQFIEDLESVVFPATMRADEGLFNADRDFCMGR